MKPYSWVTITFEQDFYIGRVKSITEDGDQLDVELVWGWDDRYRWSLRKDNAVVEKQFVLSVVEMRLSGKHFVLHQATKKELRKKHKEYCNKFFLEAMTTTCQHSTPHGC